MKRAAMLLALALLAACGGGSSSQDPDAMVGDDDPDAMQEPEPDAMPDPPDPTFTSFVIDQITNQTTSDGDAVPFADFEALPDPDQDNASAYGSLF